MSVGVEAYRIGNIDEAINMLQELKKNGKKGKVTIFKIDFDDENNRTEKLVATPEEGCMIARRSKTIIINEDEYIPHMQLFSTEQKDIEDIIRKGVMHDIIIGNH